MELSQKAAPHAVVQRWEQCDATSMLPLARHLLAVGAHAGPCHATSQLIPIAWGSAAQWGIPHISSFYPAQMFSKQEEAELVSWTPVTRNCAEWGLISLVLTTTSRNLKGKVLTTAPWRPFSITHCERQGHPLMVCIAWKCRRGDRNPKGGSSGSPVFIYFSPSDLHHFLQAWFIWNLVWLEPI